MLEFIDIRPKFKTLKKVQRTPYLSEIGHGSQVQKLIIQC